MVMDRADGAWMDEDIGTSGKGNLVMCYHSGHALYGFGPRSTETIDNLERVAKSLQPKKRKN